MRRNWITILCSVLLIGIINNSIAEEVKKITYPGRVIDYNARPVVGATVVCCKSEYDFDRRSSSYQNPTQVTTTPDGRFSIQLEKKPFTATFLVANKPGLALGWTATYNIRNPIIRLGQPGRFEGTVVDETGQPLPDAKVRICLKNPMMARREISRLLPETWFTKKTDANGRFVFDNVPKGATADFEAEAPGRASIWTTCDSGLRQGEQFKAGRTNIRIVLPPEGYIKGRVVDKESNQAIADVEILIRPINHPNWPYYRDKIYSDPNGEFIVSALAPGEYFLRAMSDKKGAANITVNVEAGKTVSDIKVPLTGCPFEVIVYDAEKGEPLENAKVTVNQIQPLTKYTTFHQQLTTDANGLALFCVPPGECEVQAIKFDYGAIFQSHRVQIEPGKILRHNVSLPRTSIVISGEVSDEQGRPVSGAIVMHTSFGLGLSALTDADGHFDTNDIEFHSSRLYSSVRVLAQHIPSGLAAAGVLNDPTKSGRPHGMIILKPAYVLTGRVTDPAGKSIPAAFVKLLTLSSTSTVMEVATDPNGVYCIRSVPPPTDKLEYGIVAHAEGFGQAAAKMIPFHDDTAKPVQIDPIILQPTNETISGAVMDANDQPVANVQVSVHGPKIIRNYNWFYYGHTLTDEKGRYRITGVPKIPLSINAWLQSSTQRGETMINGGGDNVTVVLGQNLIFSPSLIGKPLPDLKDLKVDLPPADTKDKMVLVCFFDMEQRPSRYYIIQLAKQAEKLDKKGITCIAVQASKIDENSLNKWIKKYNIPFTIGMIQDDTEKTKFDWGVNSLPWLILTDKKHIVRAEGFTLSELNEKFQSAQK